MAEDNGFQTAQLQLEHQEELVEPVNLVGRLEANPILPFGRHHNINEIFKETVRETYPGERNSQLPKLNLTVMNKQRGPYGSWRLHRQKIPDPMQTITETKNNNQQYEQGSPQQLCVKPEELQAFLMSSQHEFREMLAKNSKLLYLRLNNSKLNYFARAGRRFYSSIFFDCRTIMNQDKRPFDIYEHFRRKYPTIPMSVQEAEILNFDSNFETGNIFSVHKVTDRQYNLFMSNDTNTKGSTQWFHFSCRNRQRVKVKFNILNFYKESSLYEKGMKPLVYSKERTKQTKQEAWRRTGMAVSYEPSLTVEGISYYKLSFCYEFEYPEDVVHFAYSFPYGYTQLRRYLDKLTETPAFTRHGKKSVVCKTTLNHNIYMLEIGKSKKQASREIIYVMARQHAGQSPASYVVEGFINALLSARLESAELRQRFLFKIFPMVNPDGVVIGNYRTNLSGNDVNRKWDYPNKSLHPEVHNIKKKLADDKKDVRLFLDLHAHSRRMNSFFYGSPLEKDQHRLYPFVCSRLNKDISFQSCSYVADASKRSTARVIAQSQLGIRKAYTFQTSFYGRLRDGSRQHFQKNDLRMLGETLVLGLFYGEVRMKRDQGIVFGLNQIAPQSQELPSKTKKPEDPSSKHLKNIDAITKELEEKWKKELTKHRNEEQYDSGSDSEPEQFLLSGLEVQQLINMDGHENLYQSPKVQKVETTSQPVKEAQESPNKKPFAGYVQMHKNSNLTNHAVVKQLECQLQLLKRRNKREKEEQLREPRVQRVYMSLQTDNRRHRNYRDDVTVLKRTLKIMMDDRFEPKNSFYNVKKPIMQRYFGASTDTQQLQQPVLTVQLSRTYISPTERKNVTIFPPTRIQNL